MRDIYAPSTALTKYYNFSPTRLYIKRHSKTGMLYFGKTIIEDVYDYIGSGVRWTNHINYHGKEYVETVWVSDWYDDPVEIEAIAIHFSRENNIVHNEKWANLRVEDGLTGGRMPDDVIQRAAQNAHITMSDPIWKETVGVQQRKRINETISSEEWRSTVGVEANKKHSNTMNSAEWRSTIEVERSRKHREIKSDIEWKNTIGAEAKRKEAETKADPEWKNTIGRAAAARRKQTESTVEWKAAASNKRKEFMKANQCTCIYCGKTLFKVWHDKWHGGNCKKKINSIDLTSLLA